MKTKIFTRLIFALIGGAACLLCAYFAEALFSATRLNKALDDQRSRTLMHYFYHKEQTSGRLALAKAKSGDVEITLTWNNRNDLDLHCVDPNGEHIYYSAKRAIRTLGELDVDRNMREPYTSQPVEHIFWPRRDAPDGVYKVYVDEFLRHGDPDPTPFEVTTKEYGRIKRYPGVIQFDRHHTPGEPGQFVCEFYASPSGDKSFFAAVGFLKSALIMGLWGSMIAAGLSAALMGGLSPVTILRQNKKRTFLLAPKLFGLFLTYTEEFQPLKPSKFLGSVLDSALWGLTAGFFGQLFYCKLPENLLSFHPSWAHGIALCLIGGTLGFGLSGRVPFLPRFSATLAGMLAGLIAGRLFLAVYLSESEMTGRVLVCALIGTAIGAMINLPIEAPEEEVEVEDRHASGMGRLSLKGSRSRPAGTLKRSGRS